MRTFFRVTLLILFLAFVFGVVAIYLTFYKPVPNYNATHVVSGITDEVVIHRDEYAIPHIHAQTTEDLYFAAGFVHAQDRMWQMTLTQLMAEGRFAEFFGKDLVDIDRMLRVLGFYKTAADNFELLSEEEQQILIAYSNGVNSWIAQNERNLPIEFTLTGISPIPWTPLHSLALIRIMGWELNSSWWAKAALHQLESELSAEDFQRFMPYYATDGITARSDAKPILDFMHADFALRSVLNFEGFGAGSNAWAIDGTKSESGFAMLAGDPHLGLSMPARWYEIHYVLDEKNLSGATLPGLPLVILGQNDFSAWTLTNVMLDDTDFFQIAEDPLDRGRYAIDSTATEAEYRIYHLSREIIHVKDDDDVLHQIRHTELGPLINDIHPNEDFFSESKYAVQWTGFEPGNEFRAIYNLNWAENFQDAQLYLDEVTSPAQNIIYADQSGNIAHFITGKVPLRNNPLQLRRSWVPADRWQGYLDYDQLPHEINPERGWVANANQKFTDDNYPHYISAFWHPDARMNRIREMLEASDDISIQDFKNMQNDIYSVFAEDLVAVVLPVISEQSADTLIAEAIPYLSNWDFTYDKNEAAASIIEVFTLKATEQLFRNYMSESAYEAYTISGFPTLNRMYHALTTENDPLLSSDQRDSLIISSMQESIQFLADSLSHRSFQWRWENLHKLHLKAPIFSEAAETGRTARLIHNNILARGPFSVSGSKTTLNMGSYKFQEPFNMVLGPSIRRIVDFSDMSSSLSSMPGGQSGNPLSPYYADQLDLWLDGAYKQFYHNAMMLVNYSDQTTVLKPELYD